MNPTEAEELVTRYLTLFSDGQLDEAQSLLTADAVLAFPGEAVCSSVQEAVAGVAARYQSVGKTRNRTWSAVQGAEIVVATTGTLFGTSAEGRPFSGVRFIDVFTIREGRIAAQEVWNDAAAVGLVPPRTEGAATPEG